MDEYSTKKSDPQPSTSMTEDNEADVPLLGSSLPPKCPYCPLPFREDDPSDLPVVALKIQRGARAHWHNIVAVVAISQFLQHSATFYFPRNFPQILTFSATFSKFHNFLLFSTSDN